MVAVRKGSGGRSGGRGQACVFPSKVRRLWLVYVLATVPIVGLATVLGGDLIGGAEQRDRYLVAWVFVSGLYTLPALGAAWIAAHRAPASDRPFWRTWCFGMALIIAIGVCLLVFVATGWTWMGPITAAMAVAAIVVYSRTLVRMMRSRSGERDILIDMVELLMGVVLVTAPFALLFGQDIVRAEAAWFTVPCALTAVSLTASLLWSVMLFERLEPGLRRVEGIGIGVALVSLVNAAALVAQGLSNFELPVAPLMTLQAASMALALLTPLNLSEHMSAGLDRLPPQAQVRTGRVIAMGCIVVIPILAVEAALAGPSRPWAGLFAFCVLAGLLVLAMVRHLLTVNETRRLFSEVERAAEERRQLLADVLQRADEDRHRVAAQLHEQAVGAYAAFVAFAGGGGDADGSRSIRNDMARQAESLRQLMMAIRPIELSDTRPDSLVAPISAYLDGLYGWRPTPTLIVDVDEDLHLDWTTETIAFRILQEALRNVQRHAHATTIAITLVATDAGVELTVADDGIGFDSDANLYESGLATMRSFAAYTGGACEVVSSTGQGTTVRVLLGLGLGNEAPIEEASPAPVQPLSAPGPADVREPAKGHGRLRLVHGGHDAAATVPVG